MADRGFKNREDLMIVKALLAIPPRKLVSLQMASSDVADNSKCKNLCRAGHRTPKNFQNS